MNESVLAIKCNACGGVMSPDQAIAHFICAYCGSSVPWNDDFAGQRKISENLQAWKHRALEKEGNYVNLKRVEIDMGRENENRAKDRKFLLSSVSDKLAFFDATTDAAFSNAQQVSFGCDSCGAEITGSSLQNIFQCSFCQNKMGAVDALRPGNYKVEYIMGIGAQNTPKKALPFVISKKNAQQAAVNMLRSFPGDFSGQDIEARIMHEMTVDYLPYDVRDIAMKGYVLSNKGNFYVYQELLNWTRPNTFLYDYFLIDMLEPWDFTQLAMFDPAFTEGIVRIASRSNLPSGPDLYEDPLRVRFLREIKHNFELKKASFVSWSLDFLKHQHSFILLPVYYVDIAADNKGLQIRIAVNGQSGKVAASFRNPHNTEHYDDDYFRVFEPDSKINHSAQMSLRSEIMPIRYQKGFWYEFVPFKDALKQTLLQKMFS